MNKVLTIISEFWDILAEMSPYLLLGFAIAGFLSVVLSTEFVRRHLGGNNIWSVIKASLFGVPLPLCSCGILPVTASLRKQGAGKGACVSFIISTPQTGVDSVAITYSLLGPFYAIIRPVTAFLSGIAGGAVMLFFDKSKSKSRPEVQSEPESDTAQDCCSGNEDSGCCDTKAENKTPGRFIKALKYGFLDLPADVAGAMIVGLIIAALVSVFVPETLFADKISNRFVQMLVMMVMGIPMYVCSAASVPVAAALILKGVSPGAALVFLMTGPATNAAALTTIYHSLGRTAMLVYLGTVAVCSLLFGVILDFLAFNMSIDVVDHGMAMPSKWLMNLSAVILLAVLINGFIKDKNLFWYKAAE
ncbi:putative permease [Limihaloglobus sulfuriphilus]|uniref:Putative permease n=1 Tax=Limihaloglobus sulfuriphilus TaxID=1851148 RepID=A0A1Q2MD63_9BACT|nr:SO_0444 family Cu/Zn efflux transporter [Limihaloglobus sulfuriphilus]AQQ70635.1 putative permease [Limihaloglobus sulfuriphilus]